MSESNGLSVKRVLHEVRAMGLCCWRNQLGEYVVGYRYGDPRWSDGSSYYTTDGRDAVGTARVMAAWSPPVAGGQL